VRNESSTADDNTGEVTTPKERIDRISGNAAKQVTGFLDRVENAVVHRATLWVCESDVDTRAVDLQTTRHSIADAGTTLDWARGRFKPVNR
jgi:hypothetical protein